MTQVDRVAGLTGSVAVKAPCRVVSVADITLEGLQTIDGIALVAEDRVLVTGQDDTIANGIYYAATGAWERAPDCDGIGDMLVGTLVLVAEGTLYARTAWMCTAVDVIDVDATTFTQFFAGLS